MMGRLCRWHENGVVPDSEMKSVEVTAQSVLIAYLPGQHMLKVSHSRGTAWRPALAPRAKVLGSLGSKYIRTVDSRSMEVRRNTRINTFPAISN